MNKNEGGPTTDDGVGLSIFGHFDWLSAGSSSYVLLTRRTANGNKSI
jgi:hypothetical protein